MLRTHFPYRTLAASIIALGAIASQANAVALLDVDWDTKTGGQFSYHYESGGTVTTVGAEVIGGGVGGSDAYRTITDSSGVVPDGNNITYWGAANAVTQGALAPLTGVVSGADIGYSIDVLTEGTKPGDTSIAIRVELRFVDATTNGLLWHTRNGHTHTLIGSFETIANTLATTTTRSGSLAAVLASPNPLRLEMVVEINNGNGDFGLDAGNILVIDNALVTNNALVPEPASMALLTLGSVGLMRRHR